MVVPIFAAPHALMSKADIAEMANVDRSVVSKWIARGLGFPQPAEGGRYEPRQVADWLVSTRHGKRDSEKLREEVSLYTLVGLADRYRGDDFTGAVTALICLRHLNDHFAPLGEDSRDTRSDLAAARSLATEVDPGNELLLSEVRAIPHYAGWLVGAVDDFVEAAYSSSAAFERVIASRTKLGGAAAADRAITRPLARLMTELSGARELAQREDTITVADPATGAGDLLAVVSDILIEDMTPIFIGAEPNPALARLARRRLAVRERTEHDIRISATLPDEAGTPDVIVTQLPYHGSESRDEYAILSALGDVGVRLPRRNRFAVVLGPADVLCDDLSAGPAAERAKHLRADMVEAIIRLPVGLFPHLPRHRAALWVMTQARASRWKGHVLTIDISDRDLTDDLVDAIADEVVTWRREGFRPYAHGRSIALDKRVADLVDPPRSLFGHNVSDGEPAHRKRAADARVTRIAQRRVDLDTITETARHPVRTENLIATDRSLATESIGRLVSGGRLILLSGTKINPRHLTASGTNAVLGKGELQGAVHNGRPRRIDLTTFAAVYRRASLTERGDVLVTLSPKPVAIVDHTGSSVAENPVRVLRIPESERSHFTPRVLTALLFGDGKMPAGQALEDYRIPLLSDNEVARLDELLAELEARRDLAQREMNLLDELRQVTLRGLFDGTLSLTPANTSVTTSNG
jgi:hypothetical protein